MKPMQTIHNGTVAIRPCPVQFAIDEWPLMAVCAAGLVYGGIDTVPLGGLAASIASLLSLVLLYRFICLRRIRYCVGPEQLVSEHGVFVRKVVADAPQVSESVEQTEGKHERDHKQEGAVRTVQQPSGKE